MHEPTRDLVLFVFGLAIITGTLVAQYVAPGVKPWPGLLVGLIVLAGWPAIRAVARGVARAVANASAESKDDDV